jgi:hypothetical protein
MLARSRSFIVRGALLLACGCDTEEPPALVVEESPTPEPRKLPVASTEDSAKTRMGDPGDSGAGFGGRGKRVPQVRYAKAEITGALDRDQVRKVVREHISEVRSCYDAGLTPSPNLQNRVAIEFVIEPSGEVGSAEVHESTLKDDRVSACIVEVIQGWRFPKPADGKPVTVVYPFALSPG